MPEDVLAELKEKLQGDSKVGKAKKEKSQKTKASNKLSWLTYERLSSFIGGKHSHTDSTTVSPTQDGKPPESETLGTNIQRHLRNPVDQEANSKGQAATLTRSREGGLCWRADLPLQEQFKTEPRDGAVSACATTPQEAQAQEDVAVPNPVQGDWKNDFSLEARFWQERSMVQESGILEQLSQQELLLQESKYEVVTTEASYLASLRVAVEHFMESPKLSAALGPLDRKSLFSSITKIREISQNFLDELKSRQEGSVFCDVCEVIQSHAKDHFSAYVDYIRNMPYQEQTLHNLGKEKPQFVEILQLLQEDPRCHRLHLKSFLVLPFQRITRLKILVETIQKRTEPDSEEHRSAERALKEVSKVVEDCNREVGKMKQMEELVHIANKMEFECKGLPLVSSSRWLVKQGELVQHTDKENIFGQKKLSPVYLFLFNDLLLVAVRKGVDRFVVQDHVHHSLIDISDAAQEEGLDCQLEKSFLLVLLKNHHGGTSQRLLRASSQAERDSWVEVLLPDSSKGDKVYEEWDCPQVQCTQSYTALQPGELSLQPGDILNVIQKTTDGFMEGWQLLSGARGWFPSSFVKEINNELVQRKHLRQRYQVLQAANRLLSLCTLFQERRVSTCFR
ncbi:ephexin-1 [Amia ocellicauda]|uniref:ephexin-1 n=1 Tax=Amia ocellicauda TaxID=2972642 RepID=UPI003464C0A7